MATATAFSSILDQLLDEIPGLGYKFTATSTSGGATTTTTDPEINKGGSDNNTARFDNQLLYIPSATGADQVRSITNVSVSGATATITGLGNFGSTYTSVAHYILAIHPDILRRLGNDALEYMPVECFIPLYHGPDDADMQASAETSWTESNLTAGSGKQTTAAEVWSGARSYLMTNNSVANGYAQSTTMRVGHGGKVYAHFVAKADTGQGEAAIFDNSSNEEAVVNFTQEDWLYGFKEVTVGSADEGVFWRLRGDGTADSIDWQFAWFVKESSRLFRLPSWVDERFKVKGIARAVFHEPGDESDTWLADSLEFIELNGDARCGPVDYRFVNRQADANPHLIILEKHLPLCDPYFLVIEAPYSAPYGVAATFSTDDSTTVCPLHQIVAYMKMLIGQRYRSAFPGLEEEGTREYARRRQSRITTFIGKAVTRVRSIF